MRIALTGNPNSGKTTMYNALTGSNETVGNWAGVTVDKKEHAVKKIYCESQEQILAVDLPGAYSMSPFTSEESITRDYIINENPDVLINIVDATNLSRSLFFTTQLLELGIPLVVALNKSDINEKKETEIDTKMLSDILGCTVVSTVSTSADGLKGVISAAEKAKGKVQNAPYTDGDVDFEKKESVLAADKRRFSFVNEIVSRVETRKVLTKDKNFGDKIDAIITNKWLGIPIFAAVMFLVFQISQVWVGKPIADMLTALLERFQSYIGGLLSGANALLSSLLVDGVIGGVIAVIGFLPLVMVMYFLIALLEDCGYMSRVAVVLDPIFKKVGLSGKSVIPFVIAVGCAVPGVMASRTIKNERERRAAAMLAPFMPCGAKIPVISLFAGVFFGNAGWVSTLMYLLGIVIIFIGALLINHITGNLSKKNYFIIELPEYKFPSLWGAFKSMCARGWSYIVKAATIILLCNTAVQIMQSFNWQFGLAESANVSILASIARPFAYLIFPLVGVLSWQLAAAVITGFIAKENVVGTLAVCFSITNFISAEELTLIGGETEIAAIMELSKAAALAYLMFNLFSPPCFAAIGAMNAEMKSKKWLLAGVAFQIGVGFTLSYFVYTVGTLLFDAKSLHTGGAVCGLFAVLILVLIITTLILKNKKRAAA
ncbi:MAG: ferrous iron transporter B [Clostridia bacterium]|nr:ferrous iron transporter B [Clostridia bacterium]MBQ5798697.1 ferrous iron transporter B [Clostridia bacterium]